jgi:ubiquinone/menaquinone biosynthesis C-methylase UbiE
MIITGVISKLFTLFVKSVLKIATKTLKPKFSLKLFLNIDNILYSYISACSIKYENGIHPKHRLISYHDYFVKNIGVNENVLDIGCGNGALDYDIAQKIKGNIIGIDKNQNNIDYAKKHYKCGNLKFVCGDVLLELPENNMKFNTVIMSNLIEHIEKRVEFLKNIILKIKPDNILFRVPMYEREWMVALKDELGVEFRLDQTHYIEYVQDAFFEELKEAGLKVESYEVRWGEIWARALPDRK